MASNQFVRQFPSPAPDKVDIKLRNLDFANFRGIEAVLKALDFPGKIKLLERLVATVPLEKLVDLIAEHMSIRVLFAEHHHIIFPDGIVGKQKVQRDIIHNPEMPTSSHKFWSVCSFHPVQIAAFVNARLHDWAR